MRHYEIVMMIHPDQSDQADAMVQRYVDMVKKSGGNLHRREDWGRRQLAYPINKIHKAHYMLLNIECDQATLEEIKTGFRFNDAIIRHLIGQMDEAITQASPMMKEKESENRTRRSAPRRETSDKQVNHSGQDSAVGDE